MKIKTTKDEELSKANGADAYHGELVKKVSFERLFSADLVGKIGGLKIKKAKEEKKSFLGTITIIPITPGENLNVTMLSSAGSEIEFFIKKKSEEVKTLSDKEIILDI
ncbi:hypothetical protein KKG31_05090 [Patescibacteria group bacterium]|nr:hypothetical protein [Patescibacteria group bacterium]MBU1758498.1 hypothetical protein [Patescibacteria group bacterium]